MMTLIFCHTHPQLLAFSDDILNSKNILLLCLNSRIRCVCKYLFFVDTFHYVWNNYLVNSSLWLAVASIDLFMVKRWSFPLVVVFPFQCVVLSLPFHGHLVCVGRVSEETTPPSMNGAVQHYLHVQTLMHKSCNFKNSLRFCHCCIGLTVSVKVYQ